MVFTPRTTRPEAGNKFYITKANGGYSKAIKGKCKNTGKPDSMCDVLANCVGYSYGRFHEEVGDTTMSLCSPVDAKDFPKYTTCKTGAIPKVGAIIVWDSNNKGHVAVVEEINSDGSIIISQSGYNSTVFWIEKINKQDGNWRCNWMTADYKFTCFIYNSLLEKKEPTKKELKVDGIFGRETIIALQKILSVYISEEITGQKDNNKQYCVSINDLYWQFSLAGTGSEAIRALQSKLGVKSDGHLGPRTIKEIQIFLTNNNLYSGSISGILDKDTVKALQKYLNTELEKR